MQRLNFADINIQHILIFSAIILGAILGIYIGYNGASKLIIGGLLGAIFFVLTIMRPWIAISAIFVLIPLENLFVLQGSFTTTLSKLMGAYLIFLVIITGSLKYIYEVFINKKVLVIVLFGLVTIISALVSRDLSYSVTFIITLCLSILLYFILVLMIRDIRTLKLATWAIIVGGVISIGSPILFGYGSRGGYELLRYGGLWGDQNEFAALLLVLIPLCILNFFTSRNGIYKIISAVFSACLIVGFVLTYSRGGFLAFGVMLILTMFKIITGKNRLKILAISVPCLIIAFIILYHFFADDLLTRMETLQALENRESHTKDDSLRLRYIYYFDIAPKLFAEHPILGLGIRQIMIYNPYHQVLHNTYLEILVGMGIVGFALFMVILYLTWKELKKVEKFVDEKDTYLSLYASALEIGFIGYLSAAIFVSMDLNKMLWIVLTLPSVLVNLSRIQMGINYNKTKFKERNYNN